MMMMMMMSERAEGSCKLSHDRLAWFDWICLSLFASTPSDKSVHRTAAQGYIVLAALAAPTFNTQHTSLPLNLLSLASIHTFIQPVRRQHKPLNIIFKC
jgi:hypothetical protein